MEQARILVCEDERLVALDIKNRLQSYGHEVVGIASNGEDAIRLAKNTSPDLALMDIRLEGGLTGTEVADILGREQNIPAIYLSAYTDDITLAKAKATSGLAYLVKPVHDRELQTAIEFGLAQHRKQLSLKKEFENFRRAMLARTESGAPVQAAQLEKMRQLSKTITGFAYYFNNALHPAHVHLNWLQNCGSLQGFEKRHVINAIDSLQRGDKLLRELLWASGEGKYHVRFHSMQKVVSEVIREISDSFPQNVRVVPCLPLIPLNVLIDREAVGEAIGALLRNAAEAMPAGGVIEVVCYNQREENPDRFNDQATAGDFVVVAISDGGTGIPESHAPEVFDPFFTTKLDQDAPGLGLAIAYGVAQGHGGWVELNSSPGKGTKVKMHLPATEMVDDYDAAAAKRTENGKLSETVMITDDATCAEILQEVVEREGVRLRAISDFEKALGYVKEHIDQVEFIFLDIDFNAVEVESAVNALRIAGADRNILGLAENLTPAREREFVSSGLLQVFEKESISSQVRDWLRIAADKEPEFVIDEISQPELVLGNSREFGYL